MRRDGVQVDATATLDEVRQTMAEQNARVVAVYAGETYLGLVSIENIAEAFAVIAFLRSSSMVSARGNNTRRAEMIAMQCLCHALTSLTHPPVIHRPDILRGAW